MLTRRPVDREESLAEARRGFGFTLTALASAALVLAATYLPESVVGSAIHARQEVAGLVWPMRWGFFTATDRDFTVAYRVRGGYAPLVSPNVERQLGLSRSVNGDLARLTSTMLEIPARAWHDCVATDVRACSTVLAAGPAARVTSRLPQACGPFVFAVERPSGGPSRQIRRVAAVELAC